MRSEICILLALAAVVLAQKPVDSFPKVDDSSLDRSFFNWTTFTLIKYSTTTTSTLTSTTTCTTSTASLTTCTAGRRRRGLFYDDSEAKGKVRRSLFYAEEDNENKDGSIFLSKPSDDPAQEVVSKKKPAKDETLIPLEVQSGYSLPEDFTSNRFLLAFGTTTRTSFTVTTSTSTITATCSSVTGFSTCGSSGK